MRINQRQIQIIISELQKKRNVQYNQKIEEMMEREDVIKEAKDIDSKLRSIRPAMRKALNLTGNDYNRILKKIARNKVRFEQYIDRQPIVTRIELIAPECKDIADLLKRMNLNISLSFTK